MSIERKRYLLGQGQELFEREKWKPRNISSRSVYTLHESQERLLPVLRSALAKASIQPKEYCFENTHTLAITVHPSFISKSAMPTQTLLSFGLDLLGSSSVLFRPQKSGRKKPDPGGEFGMRLYVAGNISSWKRYEKFATELKEGEVSTEYEVLRTEFTSIEEISLLSESERVANIPVETRELAIEVLLHKGQRGSDVIVDFDRFLESVGINIESERVIDTESLAFIPLQVHAAQLQEIAKYSHVRLIRGAAKLRVLRPLNIPRSISASALVRPPPFEASRDFRVAIFDGGIAHEEFEDWVDVFDLVDGPPSTDLLTHGSNVTSAFLFGHTGITNPNVGNPPCGVDHFKVVGSNDTDPYLVLNRILGVLRSREYKFVNISMGPNYAVTDDHLDPWTVALDELAKEQDIFITIAAGNDGEADRESGNHRIQPPSDGVNVTCVGALDRFNLASASRACYSSFGPGRSPGLVKPDVSIFGGSDSEPFGFVHSFSRNIVSADQGTSFASPLALRVAAEIKSKIRNEDLTPLAVKALLLHHSFRNKDHIMDEVGWGILPFPDADAMITCEDGEVKIIYQGRKLGKKIVRTPIPIPDFASMLSDGTVTDTTKVELKVTVCLNSALNPSDAANYTRNGVEVTYRKKVADDSSTKPLFSKKAVFKFASEAILRGDCHKWATAMVGTDRLQLKSWEEPVLDFHFLERDRIGDSVGNSSIQYAIVISVKIREVANLYDLVLERYSAKLQPVRPRISPRLRV